MYSPGFRRCTIHNGLCKPRNFVVHSRNQKFLDTQLPTTSFFARARVPASCTPRVRLVGFPFHCSCFFPNHLCLASIEISPLHITLHIARLQKTSPQLQKPAHRPNATAVCVSRRMPTFACASKAVSARNREQGKNK